MRASGSGGADAPVGVGLRHAHYREALLGAAPIDFVEVHAENFFADGGAAPALLERVGACYPLSVHGTGAGLGSHAGVPATHIEHLARLLGRCKPLLVSEHASWAWRRGDGGWEHAGDLLPIAFDEPTLTTLAANVMRVQDRLGRALLMENISSYVALPGRQMSEVEFLLRLCERSGAGLLLDINNLLVNAINAGAADPEAVARAWIDALPPGCVGEFHLAGSTPVPAGEILIDDHGCPVPEPVWRLYAHAVRRFGALPTLVEWDTALPAWVDLVAEAVKARGVMVAVLGGGAIAPAPATQGDLPREVVVA